MRSVLILGGSRFVGVQLVRTLLSRDVRVTIATRGTTPDPFGNTVNRIRLERSSAASMDSALTNGSWDACIDQICFTGEDARAASIALRGRVGRYVLTSSAVVYGFGEAVRTESDFPAEGRAEPSGDAYIDGKREAERVLFGAPPASMCAVRLPMILGEDDYTKKLQELIAHARTRSPISLCSANYATNYLEVDEAAKFLADVAAESVEGPINACSTDAISIGSIARQIDGVLDTHSQFAEGPPRAGLVRMALSGSLLLDNKRARDLGFSFTPLQTWLPALIQRLVCVLAMLVLASSAVGCRRRAVVVRRAHGPIAATAASTSSSTRQAEPADRDRSVLVVVHSWSGRTERLGRELANMLGAEVIAYHDAPLPNAPAAAPSLDQVLPSVSLTGVRTLFLGFPVWGEAPSPHITRFVSSVRLDGIRVVPFYSFIHQLSPQSLATLRTAIEARGGIPLPELPFLIPLAINDAELDARARTALLARPELWNDGANAASAPSCATRSSDGTELCRVPSGIAWLGDGAPNAPVGAMPPRRVRVRAFDIGKTEITVAQYEKCRSAGACRPIDFAQSFCQQLLAETANGAALPVPCATAANAEQYCRWAGMRVPMEAEWIRGARGDSAQAFAWGDEFSPDGALRGNFGEKHSSGFESYSTVPEDRVWRSDGFRGLAPPCSFALGVSSLGLCDVAGNIAEWVKGRDGRDLLKGGSWLDGEPNAFRVASTAMLPSVFARDIGIYVTGIRCARDAG